MYILALDTTGNIATVAVTENERLLGRFTIRSGNTHSRILLPMIDSALRSLSLKAADMDVLACSAGPGSFTGVRIGAATLKGLAFGAKPGIRCVGVSSLEALARNFDGLACMGTADAPVLLCPVMDARRSQVYTSLFALKGGKPVRLWEDLMLTMAELREKLAAELGGEDGSRVLFVGDGCSVVKREMALPGAQFAPEQLSCADAYSVALCALQRLQDEPAADFSPEALAPVYLRKSQAEREREERLAKEGL